MSAVSTGRIRGTARWSLPGRAMAGWTLPGRWTSGEIRTLLLVTLAALLLFVYGLGVGTLWDQDEPKYTQVAREILQTRDLFTLHLDGQPWFVHPPLFMWLQAATGALFGFTELTARIWTALSSAGIVAVTFLLGRLLYDSTTGALAAAIAATTLHVLGQARLAVFDPTLLVFMLLAVYMALIAYATGSRRAQLWAWMWAGWATATKGPIGLILPVLVIVALAVVRREWSRWREVSLWGPVIYAAVGLPWYVIETARFGSVFLRQAIGYYLFNRFFGVVENQPGPWWYYAPVLLVGTFPWTPFVPSAIAWLARRWNDIGSQVILLWCGLTVAFYSAAGTKLPNYVFPVYPLLAIGIAHLCVDALARGNMEARRLLRWSAALLPVISGVFITAMVVYSRMKFPAEAQALRTPLTFVAAIFAGGPLIASGFFLTRRPKVALATLLLTMVVAVPVLVHSTLPAIEQYRPIPRIARRLAAEMGPDDTLAAVRMSTNASLRYYSGRRVVWIEMPGDLAQTLCRAGRVFLVVPVADDDAWVARSLPAGVRLQGEEGGYRIHVKDGPVRCTGRGPGQQRGGAGWNSGSS